MSAWRYLPNCRFKPAKKETGPRNEVTTAPFIQVKSGKRDKAAEMETKNDAGIMLFSIILNATGCMDDTNGDEGKFREYYF